MKNLQRHLIRIAACILISIITCLQAHGGEKEKVIIVRQAGVSPRLDFGVQKLVNALKNSGYTVSVSDNTNLTAFKKDRVIIAGLSNSSLVQKNVNAWNNTWVNPSAKEGFTISSSGMKIIIAGHDASGVLYGCLELAGRIQDEKKLPAAISVTDKPEMVLRGSCIGLQKPYYLPGRNVYEYPYTPQTFPWFYDRKLWIQVLDSMLDNRMNSLYLWNGHPFASLVRLDDYPYAVEVDDATFRKNEEMYRFITTEADKRGIWVIQMFYNIIVSKPFAEKHNIKTQDRERPIIPIIADYTKKSITAFVKKYPNVGLMVCLGEAMEGTGNDDIEWFTKTIIPAVKDGIAALGKTEEPPIVLRAHDTDAPAVMNAALPLYKNLYTEAKFNGEALTYARPRGFWADLHQKLSRLGGVQIENVHILANLEPFRYGSPDFIQQSVIGMHEVMGGNGLHLYPQASYWDWPYSADSVQGKRLLQIERDWIWYKAWSRYAWKSKRDRNEEISYWSGLLASRFGCSPQAGRDILGAYEQSGEIAPKLLRRFGITDGNRQTLTLGMLMTQLINPYRYGLFKILYDCESPEGEMLIEYAEKEFKGIPHTGETPVRVIDEVKKHGDDGVVAIESAETSITKNKEEFDRLKNDMRCYKALAYHYAQKAEAALHILRYKYTGQVSDLEKALPLVEQSVITYRELVLLTRGSYLYANSMQTQQRKIPLRGVNATYKTWKEVLIPFQQELMHFKQKIDSLKKNAAGVKPKVAPLKNAAVTIASPVSYYTADSAAIVFSDTSFSISALAPELKGLKGIRRSYHEQVANGTEIHFTSEKPVRLLIGFFKPNGAIFADNTMFLKQPELETNATANDYGQAETKIANAVVINGLPPVHIHSYSFPAGTHTLKLAKGICLVIGFAAGDQAIPLYDAGLAENETKKEIDWLFE